MTPKELAEKIWKETPNIWSQEDLTRVESLLSSALVEERAAGIQTKVEYEMAAALNQAKAVAYEEAAQLVQGFKWSTDNDSEVTELLAHKIRQLAEKLGCK